MIPPQVIAALGSQLGKKEDEGFKPSAMRAQVPAMNGQPPAQQNMQQRFDASAQRVAPQSMPKPQMPAAPPPIAAAPIASGQNPWMRPPTQPQQANTWNRPPQPTNPWMRR